MNRQEEKETRRQQRIREIHYSEATRGEIIAAEALDAVKQIRRIREDQRREKSNEVFGHPGAHIPDVPPITDEDVVNITLRIAGVLPAPDKELEERRESHPG